MNKAFVNDRFRDDPAGYPSRQKSPGPSASLAVVLILGAFSACNELPVHEVEPIDCSFRVIEHTFPDELNDISTGDWTVPAYEHASILLDEKYAHQLNFMMSPMMPPYMKPLASNGPIILWSDRFETMVFSPLNAFGSSWMKAEDGKLRYGMHGDTDRVPAGTVQRFLIVEGEGVNHTVDCWGRLMRRDSGVASPDRYADTGVSTLGYWTDNGAAYYYQTEGDMNEQDTLLAVKAEAASLGIPYGYFQIDSWWYFKEAQSGGLGGMLSGGVLEWKPMPEMFPDGLAAFRDQLGLPMIAHNRWVSPLSPYLQKYDFVMDDPEAEMAIPTGPELFREFMQSCLDWGIETYEQDWLVSQYFGSRWLRNEPGHLEQWLSNMHGAAAEAGLTTQICMTGAAHLMQAASHNNVTTVRTTIDYTKDVCKECYWPQFHINNMVAGALGVWPFKDNFQSSELHGQAEALVSSLSAGMVGVSDAIGKTVKDFVLATCRQDGVLLKPDRPATPIDPMFTPNERPFTVSTVSTVKGVGEWTYIAAFHIASAHPKRSDEDRLWEILLYDDVGVANMFNYPETVTDWSFDMLRDIGQVGERVLYNWRTGTAVAIEDTFDLPEVEGHNDFTYLVLAPVSENGLALIGEPAKYVTMADKRMIGVKVQKNGFKVTVAGKPGERVELAAFDTRVSRMLEPGIGTIGADGTAVITIGRALD